MKTPSLIRSLKFIKEFWSIPAAIIIWWFGGYAILAIDESAALIPVAKYESLLMGTIFILFAYSVAKLGVLTNFTTIRLWLLQGRFRDDWFLLSSFQRICIYLLIQGFLMIAFLAIALTIFARL